MPTGRRIEEAEKMVRLVTVFLSLYSIQLIVISALLMTYLGLTAANKTETENGNALIIEQQDAGVIVVDTELLSGEKGIEAASLQAITTILEPPRTSLEPVPITSRQAIGTSTVEIIEVDSLENESGFRGSASFRPTSRPAISVKTGRWPDLPFCRLIESQN